MSAFLKDYIAWIALPDGQPIRAADIRLETDPRGRHLASGMRYRSEWLRHPQRYPINPAHLPLNPNPVEWETGHIPALIDEVLPGRWERAVQQRVWGREADIDDLHAVLGADRQVWRAGSLEILSPDAAPPPLESSVSLSDLDALVDEVERSDRHLAPELEALSRMQAGSSVGGARPKVLIDDGGWLGGQWLAKFQRRDDSFNQVRVEHACLLLADRAGLAAAESRVISIKRGDVLLVRRFDVTEAGGRRGMVSTNALLKDARHQSDPAHPGYEDLVTCIRRFSTEPAHDLGQIYGQMLLNEAINNRDDHLKNFSFLLGPGRIVLSPAYDLVPSEALGAYPQLGFDRQPHLPGPTTPEAIAAARAFGLTPAEARQFNDRIAAALSNIQEIMDQAELAAEDRRYLLQRLPRKFRPAL
ncbi:MAG: type II toxin-antitoxin system HipA family toxin [Wenzhouxiangellaceae bacterium]